MHESLLTGGQLGAAAGIAMALQAAAIASLYLRMDIDWKFGRVRPAGAR